MSKFVSNITLFILTAVIILLPIDAVAQTTTPYIGLNKTANYDYTTHTGIITLDSFVTGSSKVTRSASQADICLVLDFSSSMKDDSKNTMLQNAANAFVDSIAVSAHNNDVNHRIGIIIFGTGAHIKTDFISVKDNPTNVATLKGFINSTCPAPDETATRYDIAMLLAQNMIYGGSSKYVDFKQNENSNAVKADTYGTGALNPGLKFNDTYCLKGSLVGIATESKPFVVFLTDGEPTGADNLGHLGQFYGQGSITTIDTPGTNGYTSDSSRYGTDTSWPTDKLQFGIANYAIRITKDLKENKSVNFYSIHIDPNDNAKSHLAEDALRAMSSQYPHAERYRQKFWGTKADNSDNFYQRITSINQANILGAFSIVSSSIEEVVSIQYGTETIMNDFINNTYFKLTDAVNPSDPWSSINVYKVRCTGIDSDGSTRTFGTAASDTTQLHASDGINITINKATSSSENDQILVSGYNYSENWCGIYNSSPHGYKLVVKVPFEFTGGVDTPVPGTVNTNSSGSGIYPAQKNDDGTIKTDTSGQPIYDSTPEEVYISPTIDFCTMLITRVGLDPDESAVYEVTCDNKFVARVALNGTEASSVSKYLYGLPGGNYTVTETGWNWAYDKKIWDGSSMVAGNVLTKTVDTPNTPIEFKFGGAHKTGTGPEDLHNHDEKYKVNRINVSDL